MRKDIALLAMVTAFSCPGLMAQQSLAPLAAPQVAAPAPQKRQPAARAQGSSQPATLTNADVAKMVRGGVPESTIITSIQSSTSKFDLSPDALVALHRAGASDKILNAMMAGGGAQQSPASPATTGGGTAPGTVQPTAPATAPRATGSTPSAIGGAGAKPGSVQSTAQPSPSPGSGPATAAVAPLTNADVIKMVKSGVPESDILSSIRSGPAGFDLSPRGYVTLRRARVNQRILDAMKARASALVGPSTAAQKNQTSAAKLPPGTKVHQLTAKEFQTLAAKTRSAPRQGKPGPVVRNPRAAELNSSLIGLLSQQRQAADTEFSQMKTASALRTLPAVHRGASSGDGSRLNGGTMLAGRTTVQRTSAQPNIGSEKIQGEQTGASKYATLPNLQVQSGCALSNGQLAIGKVTGDFHALTFTPISQYNLYTIHGCNFGDASPGAKAWIYGLGFHADFQIELWTDNAIAVKVGENISGVLDQDNLHLVVHRADGKEAQADGFKFYAAREAQPVLLGYIPPAWRKLDWQVWPRPTLQSNSPVSGPYVPKDAVGVTSVFVSRFLMYKFPPSGDSFDFSQLPRGWVVDSAEWITYPADCPDVVTYREDFGQWNVQWNASVVQISWGDTSCSGFFPNPFFGFPTSAYQNKTESTYALKVWVNGPRGTESLLPHM